MIEVGSKFDVTFGGNKIVPCKALAGRKFARLMAILQQLQESTEQIESELFEQGIPEALSICLGDEERAKQMWDEEVTFKEAMEIITAAVQAHIVGQGDMGKSE